MNQSVSNFPITKIQVRKMKFREVNQKDPAFLQLKRSIAAIGVQQELLVRPIPGVPDEAELIAGGHRLEACKQLGKESVPVKMLDIDDNSAQILQALENDARVRTSPRDRATHYAKFMSRNPHMSQKDVAEAFFIPESELSKILSLNRLSEGASQAMRDGRITAYNGYILAKLPEEHMDMFLTDAELMKGNEFEAHIAAAMKEIRKANRESRDPRLAELPPALLPKGELWDLYETAQLSFSNTPPDHPQYSFRNGFAAALKQVYQLDDDSVLKRKAERESQKEKKNKEREMAAHERRLQKVKEFEERAHGIAVG